MTGPLDASVLPDGIRARHVDNGNGLLMHVLEAGDPARPCILLLHGFPELAYSWRRVMVPLAGAGFHVVAPDQRGYGRTTGWDASYDGDLAPFTLPNLVDDAVGLLRALGRTRAAAVFGHDFGSMVAGCAALLRPEAFGAVAMMSAPWGGPAPAAPDAPPDRVHDDLAALDPPRLHYQWHYSTRGADAEMRNCPQGVHAFLRAYFHFKSADWKGNRPFPLAGWSAPELAKMPTYYIMEAGRGMAETVAPEMPSEEEIAACGWLPERELAVYAGEFSRTGFQGGLQWYRCMTGGATAGALAPFAARRIAVPACYVAGASDWGVHQKPGELDRMRALCGDFRGIHLVDGAGHWVQQERPGETARLLLRFLDGQAPALPRR